MLSRNISGWRKRERRKEKYFGTEKWRKENYTGEEFDGTKEGKKTVLEKMLKNLDCVFSDNRISSESGIRGLLIWYRCKWFCH